VAAAPAPSTLNDFAELARKSIAGELPATPAPPVVEPGQEPSPELTPAEPAEPLPAAPEAAAGDEPTADEMATWTEGEKKLHGALVKERTESKDARAELRAVKEQLAEIQKQIKPPPATPAEPVSPAGQPTTAPSAGEMLADCQTFEAVDARVTQAAATESEANRLQQMLNRNGVEAVAERLKASGVEKIGGTPLAEASADLVGDFLAAVYEGARMTQAQAQPRKVWLAQNQQSLAAAVQLFPELGDKQSPAFQSAQRILVENPLLRQRSDWPVLLTKLYLGEQAYMAKTKPAASAAPAVKAAPKPPAKAAPGAPRTSVAALPRTGANDALSAKIKAGTASLAEVQEYTRSFVAA
jgi:hypothetical protein